MSELSTIPYALVAEDDPLILMAACDILEAAGFRYLEVPSGDAAKLVLDKNGGSIALLFTDVEMPGATNGFALARYASEHWPEIAIVVASGRSHPGPGDMPDGATFIAKPFSADVVHTHLRQILPDGRQPEPLKKAV